MKATIRTIRKIFLYGVSFMKYDWCVDKYKDIIEALKKELSEEERELYHLDTIDNKQCVIDEVGRAGFIIDLHRRTPSKEVIFFTWEEDDALTPTISNIGIIEFMYYINIKPVMQSYGLIKYDNLEDLCRTFKEIFIDWFDRIIDYLITDGYYFSRNYKIKSYQEKLKNVKTAVQNIKNDIFVCGSLCGDGYVHYNRQFITLCKDESISIKEIEVDTPKTNEPEQTIEEVKSPDYPVEHECEKVIKSPKYLIEYECEIKPITTYRKINEVAKKLSNEIDFNVSNNIAKRTCYTMTFKNDINGDLGRFRDPIIFKISNKGFKYLKVLFDSNKYPANSYIFKTKNKEIKIKIDGENVHLIWAPNNKVTEKDVTVRREEKLLNLIFELFGLLNVRVGCKR